MENIASLFLLHEFVGSSDPHLGLAALASTVAALSRWTLLVAVFFYAVWVLLRRHGPRFLRSQTNTRLRRGGGSINFQGPTNPVGREPQEFDLNSDARDAAVPAAEEMIAAE